jgi:transposase
LSVPPLARKRRDPVVRTPVIRRHQIGEHLPQVLRRYLRLLRGYLENPTVAIDTNPLERTLRVIPMGRKSWLFCWTELVGIVQSLLTTCRLHGVNPSTYLIDVLQRVSEHPAARVEELTPRLWKGLFADNPLRSDIDQAVACQ